MVWSLAKGLSAVGKGQGRRLAWLTGAQPPKLCLPFGWLFGVLCLGGRGPGGLSRMPRVQVASSRAPVWLLLVSWFLVMNWSAWLSNRASNRASPRST